MSDFTSAAPPSGGIHYADYLGALLLVDVIGVETAIQTAFGPNDAVRANIVVLDGPNAGEVITDTLVFPRVLRGQLARSVGGKVLGRLGQGNAKPGQSAPWLLNPATPADEQTARNYLSGQFQSAPATQQQPAQASGWGQQGGAGAPPF